MGAPDEPELAVELTNSFCRTDPEIAKHFARVTFLSDHRADLPKLKAPALILQCSDDIIAPRTVGDYMHKVMADSTLKVIDNIGHCPHLSSPGPVADAMDTFLHQKVL
jgi:sigma-B regulation protein RsbQ